MRIILAAALLSGCAHRTVIQTMVPHETEVLVLAVRHTDTPFGTVYDQTLNACDLDRDSDRLVCRAIGVDFDAQLPKIGISYQDRDDGGEGAVITLVREGGFAAAAGLATGDIVVAANGMKTSNRADLAKALETAGKTLTLTVLRGEETLALKVERKLKAKKR
jgi:C-terminal processing protease CtpA/Prc